MENASKALIIAGAILISILLISVGIIIMNAINDPVQQGADTAKSQAAEIFNNKFSSYLGEQNFTTLKSLYTAVNSVPKSGDPARPTITTWNNSWSNKDKFSVTCTYSDAGYINKITVTKK